MNKRLLFGLFVFALLMFGMTNTSSAHNPDVPFGEEPLMLPINNLRMTELICPNNAVLVVQNINRSRAWISCPPGFIYAFQIITPTASLLTATPVSTAQLPTATPLPVATATATNTPALVPTVTNTPVPLPTATPTATKTPLPTATAIPVATATMTPLPTATATPLPTLTPTATVLPTLLSLQPDAVLGVDTFVREDVPGIDRGNLVTIQVDSTIGARRYGMLLFDLTSIPVGSTITSAALVLSSASTVAIGIPFSVHSIFPSVYWVESGGWDFAQPNLRWAGDALLDGGTDAGGSVPNVDYYAVPLGSATLAANAPVGTPITVALDPVQLGSWLTGGNYGLTLRASGGGMFSVYSSDHANAAQRPKLNVTYVAAALP